jgi:hypothetical protein
MSATGQVAVLLGYGGDRELSMTPLFLREAQLQERLLSQGDRT